MRFTAGSYVRKELRTSRGNHTQPRNAPLKHTQENKHQARKKPHTAPPNHDMT